MPRLWGIAIASAGYFYGGGMFWTIGGALPGGMTLVVVVDWFVTRFRP